MSGGDVVWFRNRADIVVLISIMLIGTVSGGILAAIFLPFSISTILIGLALTGVIALLVLGEALAFKVGIGADHVVVRRLLRSVVIRRADIQTVVLDPPVLDIRIGPQIWRGSHMRVHFRANPHKPLWLSGLPDGLKLRVARVLDPVRYPGDPLEFA